MNQRPHHAAHARRRRAELHALITANLEEGTCCRARSTS